MDEVRVYISTSPKVGRIAKGAYAYIMECIRHGEPITKGGRGVCLDTTKDRMTLTAMNEALDRIRPDVPVVFIPDCKSIYHIIDNKWHERWQANGYQGSRGEVSNADLWKIYMSKAAGREIRVDEKNTYRIPLKKEIDELERRTKDADD